MPTHYKYLVTRYKQHPETTIPLMTFVANAVDILDWAGVPRKAREPTDGAEGTEAGFQRALSEERVEDIDLFFDDPSNVSPTAVVVAFRQGKVKLTAVEEEIRHTLSPQNGAGELWWLEFDVPDVEELTDVELIDAFVSSVGPRLTTPSPESDVVEGDAEPESDEELIIRESHLKQFVTWLKEVRSALDAGDSLPEGVDHEDFRATLESMLLPAMLVDGQHRTEGAAKHAEQMPFCVCALVESPWEEQVFQFVVINQKSERIKSPFLSAIISSSLTQQEVERVRQRLEAAGVRIIDAELMNRVNTDPTSPFRDMIKFDVVGERGWLPYAGMKSVTQTWWNLDKKIFKVVAADVCPGDTIHEKREAWQQESWWTYFTAFWETIRDKYGVEEPGEVNLWLDRNSQLMRIASLETLQELFLGWMYISRRTFEADADAFKSQVLTWCQSLPVEFFREEWVGARLPKDKDVLRDSMYQRLLDESYHWRKSKLFRPRT